MYFGYFKQIPSPPLPRIKLQLPMYIFHVFSFKTITFLWNFGEQKKNFPNLIHCAASAYFCNIWRILLMSKNILILVVL